MPPNISKKKKRSKQRSKQRPTRPSQAKPPPPKFSVDDLTEAASVALANQEVDTAVALYTAALAALPSATDAASPTSSSQQQPSSKTEARVDLLEKRAEAYTLVDNPDGARDDYQQALTLHQSTESLESGPAWYQRAACLYCYLGQTSTGHTAVAAYEQALRLLEASVAQVAAAAAGEEAVLEMTQQLASACCNAAEVYLTDLCEEPDAEAQCEQWVTKALTYQIPASSSGSGDQPPQVQLQPTVDALMLLANLRVSQCRWTEAPPIILQAYRQIEVPCRALARLVDVAAPGSTASSSTASATTTHPPPSYKTQVDEQAQELSHMDAIEALPGFEFRCQLAKIMIELGVQDDACACPAVYVLGSLLAENDEVVEVWVLLGDAFASNGGAAVEEAVFYWKGAMDMLNQLQQSMQEDLEMASTMEEDEDPEAEAREDELQQQLDDVMCQLDELRRKMEELQRTHPEAVEAMQE